MEAQNFIMPLRGIVLALVYLCRRGIFLLRKVAFCPHVNTFETATAFLCLCSDNNRNVSVWRSFYVLFSKKYFTCNRCAEKAVIVIA